LLWPCILPPVELKLWDLSAGRNTGEVDVRPARLNLSTPKNRTSPDLMQENLNIPL
jgi:hypothetical protein